MGEATYLHRPLQRPGMQQDNVKIDYKETGLNDVDWINLAQNRDQYTPLCIW
jgi:hypothetical protein